MEHLIVKQDNQVLSIVYNKIETKLSFIIPKQYNKLKTKGDHMKKYAYLIGNGLNRATDNTAWVDMLEELRKKYKVESPDICTNLPLEFERIYLEALSSGNISKVYELKSDVARYLPQVTDLSLHQKFLELPVSDILTTNYDYYIEKALDSNFKRKNFKSVTNEKKHSILRCIMVRNKNIWHIHGEAERPASICLGYDQYGTYLSRVIASLTTPQQGMGSNKPYLRYFFERNAGEDNIWLTKLFTHDIFIFGLSLSFIESELWWLLSYRRRFMLENTQYHISNRIYYFYAVTKDKCDQEQLNLLDSMGVELCPIQLTKNNWGKLYQKILSEIKKIINQNKRDEVDGK